jgi:hypothetical protein
VVAIDPERDVAFDKDEALEDPLDVLDICSSLVTTSTFEYCLVPRTVVILAHYSVKEYLLSERCRQGPACHFKLEEKNICNEHIANCCLGYLLQFQHSDSLADVKLTTFKLAQYSATFWAHHAREVSINAKR